LREFFLQHEDWIDILDEVGIGPEAVFDDINLTKALAADAVNELLPISPAENEYARLCRVAEKGQRPSTDVRKRGVKRDVTYRLVSAREAVILRSGGHCENPDCGGAPKDVTMGGAPIIEVDHVIDLARYGPDHPSNMIALCPNCHAVKTRGRTREELRAKLVVVARQRHEKSFVG
jgi:5-methylcytosine-specific restriction protein A